MNKMVCAIPSLLFLSLTGCAIPNLYTQTDIVPVEEPQEFQVTIIEGKTTKQEIIDALGMPDNLSNYSMDYSFYMSKDLCKLNLTQKDGTIFNVIICDNLNKGSSCQYRHLNIYLDSEKPIVDHVDVY